MNFLRIASAHVPTDPAIANGVSPTSATLTWTVPADVGAGVTYARVRLSYDTITDATGKLGTGEVEDYSMLLPSSSLPSGVNDASTRRPRHQSNNLTINQ
jgi:hypothetical protein